MSPSPHRPSSSQPPRSGSDSSQRSVASSAQKGRGRILGLTLGSGVLLTWAAWTWLSGSHPTDLSSADQASGSPTSTRPESTSEAISTRSPSAFDLLLDHTVPYQLRVQRLRDLDPAQLTSADLDALDRTFDHRPPAHHAEFWWVVVNEVMEQSRRHGLRPSQLTSRLSQIIQDDSAPEVLRDYAIQHLSQWINPREDYPGAPSEQDPEKIAQVKTTLLETLLDPQNRHNSLPGTTLMVLGDLYRSGVPLPEEALQQKLTPWLQDAIAGQLTLSKINRISALGAAGMLQLTPLQPNITAIARDSKADPSLRLSAIAALGHLGTPDDQAYLTQLTQTNSRFKYAARTALEKLNRTSR